MFIACRLSAVGILLVLFAPAIRAQVTTADIVGTVTDASAAIVPGARIVVNNLATAAEYSAVADGAGNYLFRLLPVGRYRLRSENTGFKTWTVPEVTLAAGDRLRQDLRLELGEVTQTVEVTAETPALQSEASSLGNLVTERAVQDLPLNGRNFINLVQLTSGANDLAGGWATGNSPDDRRRTSAVSVNAQGGTSNNYLIDGMDDNERFISTLIVKPSIEGIAEVKVQTNLYSAELGRAGGGVMNIITKSGANAYHGSLFEFFRNEKLDAKNFFAVGSTPPYKQSQFGGSLGGPIRRKQTFFFGDFEEYRVIQGLTYTSTVPTLAMRQGNFSGVNPIFNPLSTRTDPNKPGGYLRDRFPNDVIPPSSMDPVGIKLINLYPQPLTSGLANNFTLSPPKRQTDDTFDVRVDHKITDADDFYARYSFNDTRTWIPGALPVDSKTGIDPVGDVSLGGPGLQRAQSAQVSHVHTFSPRLALELKFGYSRIAINSLPPNYGKNVSEQLGIKGVNVDQNSTGLSQINPSNFRSMGDGGYIPLITFNNLFQPAANLMLTLGAHNIKVGADLRRRQVAEFQSPNGQGTFSFDPNFTNDPSGAVRGGGNSMASLLLGYPSSTSRSKYLVYPGYRLLETAAYVQDDWRTTRWLTLNIGLRYEYFSPITEARNRISNFDIANARIVIAAKDGVPASAGPRKDRRDFAPRFGMAATLSKHWVLRGGFGVSFMPPLMGSNMAFRNPPFSSLLGITTATPGLPINRISDGLPLPVPTDPLNPSGSLTAVAFDFVTAYLEQYNLTLQRELPRNFVASASYVGVLGRRQPVFVDFNQVSPGPGAVNPRRPYYSVFPNLSSINVYTPGGSTSYNALQMNLERRFSKGFGVLATYTWGHSIDNSDIRFLGGGKMLRVKGNSSADLRQRFTLTSNYELPFAKTAKGLAGGLARGWRLNGIVTMQTGTGITVGVSPNQLNGGGPNRANLAGDPNLPRSERTLQNWFNKAAFTAPPPYTVGNSGRGIFRGPGKVNFDVSLHREFAATERMRVQFRAEAFNVANTPSFGNPGSSLGSPSFGVISSAGSPRNLQFALKLLF